MPEDLNLVNKLYYGDNLFIMREFIPDECVDLTWKGYARVGHDVGKGFDFLGTRNPPIPKAKPIAPPTMQIFKPIPTVIKG